ncbi:hypothetical protein F5B17DRAFT_453420 [Nemania serpens]|nr:hypothetical protein F5B17DRAFT_453420 [Nemania serpens]
MAKHRKSRAYTAPVQDTINLIKSMPRIRRALVRNPTRTLTLRQYAQLLPFLEETELYKHIDYTLRYNYTRSTRQFEIRTTNVLIEGIIWEFLKHFILWQARLMQSNSPTISNAARSLQSHGNADIRLPISEGPNDTRSPDGGILHYCSLHCHDPTVVFEVVWTDDTREELRDKAEAYIVGTKGKERYRASQVDENGRFSYPGENGQYAYEKDEENVTGGASILVWQAQVKNNIVTMGRVHETKIRDRAGNTIPSARLRLPLEDCVCDSIVDSVKAAGAPLLEISSEVFCDSIQKNLRYYRMKRDEILREAEVESRRGAGKGKKEEEEEKQREGRAFLAVSLSVVGRSLLGFASKWPYGRNNRG